MAVITEGDVSAHDLLEGIWQGGAEQRSTRVRKRRERPVIRIWDGDWNLFARVVDAIEGRFQWKMNDTGQGVLSLPVNHRVTKWVMDPWGRTKKNVHITMDKDGARWGGRLDDAHLRKMDDGQRVMDLIFLHDYEELKWLYVWPNPFLPAGVQFPKSFVLAGPAAWTLKTALLVNVLRTNGNLWALPDDPLDLGQWDDTWRPQDWSMMVKPTPFGTDQSPWTVISSRMKTWHSMAETTLADAQLSVECRRYLDGDPEPWPGYRPRNGQLIIDVVDKSGWWSEEGTSFFGTVWNGLVRTVQHLTGNNIDTDTTVIPDPSMPQDYFLPDWLGTNPHAPYVVYRDGAISGVEAADFHWKPAKSVQELSGGHSAPGVNELISAAVQLVGNSLGQFVFVPTAGTIADTLLAPLYEDVFAAWMSIKSIRRAQELGWDHYEEHFAEGGDRGYTLSSLLALRKGFWDTREKFSHQLQVRDGAPWFVGDQGHGHFFLGDRIGGTIIGLPEGRIVVEQVTELEYGFSRDELGWTITSGDPVSQQSSAERIVGNVNDLASTLHDLGVL